ncbi:coiled-coil domain-containing protein 180 [Polypterus senegalus]|uniref:coiled-coil domain-containing protein 180 n=1 Tax=Polypterus senegalus TaxID=55291 RepID=UPI00196612D1|nr:coiled-coil domain-containing protein 180 [Polypterus senegalus]XP_039618539.1 coiled-coil domain-containing protein 180 [Polypterus senegalus]
MGEVRVVPSGKVYRQIFDAEVQLVKTLEEARKKRIPRSFTLNGRNVPSTETLGTGGRTNPSQANFIWAQSLPTDSSVEIQEINGEEPLTTLKVARKKQKKLAEQEVHGLDDVIVSEKCGSDIIERWQERKQQTHEKTVDSLHEELTLLSGDFEPLFIEAGDALLHNLSESERETEELMQKIDKDSDLHDFTLEGLCELWDCVSQQTLKRREWIEELDKTFTLYECERAQKVAEVLKRYTKSLEEISFLMPFDIHRLIHKESMMINQAFLANRRALGKLHMNLLESNLKMEQTQHLRWKERLHDWKAYKSQMAVEEFKRFLSSQQLQTPEGVQRDLAEMREIQESLNRRRLSLLQSLSAIVPPQCTNKMVEEWCSSLCQVNEKIDRVNMRYMNRLHLSYEQFWQSCLERIDQYKEEMLKFCLLSEKEIQQTVDTEFMPLVGSCQTEQEKEINIMDKAFEALAKSTSEKTTALCQFIRDAAELWGIHTSGLAGKEEILREKLEKIRQAHEQEHQMMEAKLDILLDKLRQENTEEMLKSTLDKAQNSLKEIGTIYDHFCEGQVAAVSLYPDMVLQELQAYAAAVKDFFNVRDESPARNEDAAPGSEGEDGKNVTSVEQEEHPELTKDDGSTVTSESSGVPRAQSEDPNLKDVPAEIFTTSDGRRYAVLKPAPPVIVCQDPECPSLYTELVLLTESTLMDTIKRIRGEFFEHLDQWHTTTHLNSKIFTDAKADEFRNELKVRLHLHEPRATRIELDIHNVRAAELLIHKDRVHRHCKGVTEALNNIKNEFTELCEEEKTLTSEFRKHIFSMEAICVNATKSEKVEALFASLSSELDSHMGTIQACLRQFRQKLETTMGNLRDTNAAFIKCFRLFSEGGTFSPEEIETFKKSLEKTSNHVDATDESIMLDLEGMEARCLEQAMEIITKFEDKFQYHAVDLSFMEKIQRLLTNTQVKLKKEVASCNLQMESISNSFTDFEKMIRPFSKPGRYTPRVTPDELYTFTLTIMEKVNECCRFLGCLLDLDSATSVPESPLQGSFAIAARYQSFKQEAMVTFQNDGLLQPSRMGKPAVEDVALRVIQNILQTQKTRVIVELPEDSAEKAQGGTASAPANQTTAQSTSRPGSVVYFNQTKSSSSSSDPKNAGVGRTSSTSIKRFRKPTRFDKRFQVFGPKVEEEPTNFKEVITAILWESNDVLLALAEEFYKKKDKRPITRPEFLPESFENCGEMLNQKLLVYQKQVDDYYNCCVLDFRQQVTEFEQQLPLVPRLMIENLGSKYLKDMEAIVSQAKQAFVGPQRELDAKQAEYWNLLRPRVGHPASASQLDSLCDLEKQRQREQLRLIDMSEGEVRVCVLKQAEEFAHALATLTECILLKLDEFLTVDEIQPGTVESASQRTCTLIRRKQSGFPLEMKEQDVPLIQRGSRTWPGLTYFEPKNSADEETIVKKTASIKTAKTTLGHTSVVETRDRVYKELWTTYEAALESNKAERAERWTNTMHWEAGWKDGAWRIGQLYS